MSKKLNWTIFGGIILVIIVVGVAMSKKYSKPSKYDSFAICLKDKGVKFYGAWWCPHCKSQKELFGKSAKLLPYIECSTADGGSQIQLCKDAKIEGYPTWELSDGTRLPVEDTNGVSLKTLSEKSGCLLPDLSVPVVK